MPFWAAPSSCLPRPLHSCTASPGIAEPPFKSLQGPLWGLSRGLGDPSLFFLGMPTLGWSPAGRDRTCSVIPRHGDMYSLKNGCPFSGFRNGPTVLACSLGSLPGGTTLLSLVWQQKGASHASPQDTLQPRPISLPVWMRRDRLVGGGW